MEHYSRAHWAQIIKRARQVKFRFDPSWKCLICGTPFVRCWDHNEDQNDLIAAEAQRRATA
jgi:hypothetical protein